jgi:DNA-directed RNA polymerase subunit RPC12/RpoP
MQKKELRSLRRLDATDAMIQKAKLEHECIEYGWKNGHYGKVKVMRPVYRNLFRVQSLQSGSGRIIKAAVFSAEMLKDGIRTPRYEIFINEDGGEWITRELDDAGQETRWLTAMVGNLDQLIYSIYWRSKRVYLNRDAKRTFDRLPLTLDTGQTGVKRLIAWQEEQREKERLRKEEKEQEPWDEDMALVPEIMPGFLEWMRKDATEEHFIFYRYRKDGATKGYCSRCRKDVPINGPKHNKDTECPSCGAKAKFKVDSKIQTLKTKPYDAEVIQRIEGGIVVRRYQQRQRYINGYYWKPKIDTEERSRYMFFEDGEFRKYDWDFYKNKKFRWVPSDSMWSMSTYYAKDFPLYRRNLAQVSRSPILQKSAMRIWGEIPLPPADYLYFEMKHPMVEMLAKIGMFKLARQRMRGRYYPEVNTNENETELAKILLIDNARLKRLREMDGGVYHLRWMQVEKRANTIWSDDMIREFADNEIVESDLYFLEAPFSYLKAYNYIKKQMQQSGEQMRQTVSTWRDYICMADRMKMDTKNPQIERPKDLKAAHDKLVRMEKEGTAKQEAEKIEKDWPKVNKQLKKLERFEFEKDGYCIKAPKNVYDIVMEGEILSHCVHRCDYYFERITNDESYLFFLRKADNPDAPWYTLEVEPSGNIRQKRTTGDNQNPDFEEAVPFLKAWQQYFKKQLTKKEKELGKKSDELRRENYKKLREDGKAVWHGKLAGQLLADVLEKDFMEAM